MYRRNGISAMGVIFAVVVSVLAVSIVWATYSTTLKVSGSATVAAGKWNVIFANAGSCTVSNLNSMTTTASYGTLALDANSTTISGLAVSLVVPGDKIVCTFNVTNQNTFPAKIKSTFTQVSTSNYLNCSSNQTFCNTNVTTKLTYDTESGTEVNAGDAIAAGTNKTLILTIIYNKDLTAANLPASAINATMTDISIPIEQS